MTVSRIEPLNKQKSKVFLDGDFAFVLYQGEIYRYQIKEGEELEARVYEELLQTVERRAREKALSLLQLQDRSEFELGTKLRRAFFPETAVEQVICFLKEYGYLNDEKYARNYAEIYGTKKSCAELKRDLRKKGISAALVQEVCREQQEDKGSSEAIAALLKKRGYRKDAPLKERQKTIAYLLRRGFSWAEIQRAAEFPDDSFL